MKAMLGRHLRVRAAVGAALFFATLATAPADAIVTSVVGNASGYSCNVTIFATFVCSPTSATPSVTLAADASNSPVNATVMTGTATAGPATLFSSGQISVSTQGSTGPGGSVSSTSTIQNVNAGGTEA